MGFGRGRTYRPSTSVARRGSRSATVLTSWVLGLGPGFLSESNGRDQRDGTLTATDASVYVSRADPVVRKELPALRATPMPLAREQLRHQPAARLHRRIEDHRGDRQLSSARSVASAARGRA
jgi:hypothetical protein